MKTAEISFPTPGLADRLQAAVRNAPADGAEIVAVDSILALTRFASSVIHQNVSERNWTFYARAVVGQRSGVALGNDPSPEGLEALLREAAGIAAELPEDPLLPPLIEPRPVDRVDGFRESTAAATPGRRADAVRSIADRLGKDGLEASGSFSTGVERILVANSAGVAAEEILSQAALRIVAVGPEGMGSADVSSRDVDALDPQALAEEAAEVALKNRDPQELAPGAYRAMLTPACVREVLRWLAFTAFGARSWLNGSSFLAGAIGERSLDPKVTICDDPRHPAAVGLPFDFEGVPKRRTELVVNGVNRGVCFDRVSAAEAGEKPTGHAPLPGSPHGGYPANPVLEAGDGDEAEMLNRLERGILIRRFHYVNGFLDPRTALMTGMTRYGTFWVEDGEIRRALKNLRWTQSFVDALGKDLLAVGNRCDAEIGRGGATVAAPSLLVENFRITGATG